MKLFLLAILFSANVFAGSGSAPDLTSFGKTWKPKHAWPAESVEKATGFHLGGTNTDATLKALTSINGIALGELERRMRPGVLSPAGFLGAHENLVEVLRRDNDFVVGKKKSTHRKLALAMAMMEEMGQKVAGQFADRAVRFVYQDATYEYRVRVSDGFTVNPFSQNREVADAEQTTSGSGLVTLKNFKTKQQVSWSTMMPFLIQRYGFYEGEGTPYRVSPEKLFAVMTFLN